MANSTKGGPSKFRDSATGKFLPGWKGPGRPRGSTKKDEYKQMLAERTPEVLKKVIDLAVEGDLQACKLILDRVYPVHSAAVEEIQQQIEELREQVEWHRSPH